MQGGTDAGDHPPITPIASATEAELGGGDTWRLYDYVARHFLGSLSPDCSFTRTTALLSAGQEAFSATGTSPKRPGFTAVMPWRVRPCCLLASVSVLWSHLSLKGPGMLIAALYSPRQPNKKAIMP